MKTTMSPPEFSVSPFARLAVDPDDPRFDELLDELDRDDRALGVGGVTTSLDGAPVSTVFQVEAADLGEASDVAVKVFDRALERAGFGERTAGVAVVEGGDPDQLP